MSKSSERGNKGLTQNFVDQAPKGRHLDYDGLYLIVKAEGQGSWQFRKQHNGKRQEIGIGSTRSVNLKTARALAAKIRIALIEGNDPKAAIGRGVMANTSKDWTLSAVTARCFESKQASLKDNGKAGRWLSPLELHVLPKIGKQDVTTITAGMVKTTLAPIWHEKHVTAKKAANRLSIILRYASDEGAAVDEVAVDKAKRLLGAVIVETQNIESTPSENIPALYASVCALETTPATLAVRLAILTGHRATPIRFAKVEEFDLENRIWTAPAENMKGQKGKVDPFRCPLSDEAVRIVDIAMQHARLGNLFPAQRGNGVVSDVGMAKVFKRTGFGGTTHGLRTSFAEWALQNEIPQEMSDRCLQHQVGNAVSRAYHRDDLLERRRSIMEDWATYATSAKNEALRAGLRVI